MQEYTIESPNVDWDTFSIVEDHWDRRCRKNWQKFLRACAVALLDRLPPEAAGWISAADHYERGESSEADLKEMREEAWHFYRTQEGTAAHANLCRLSVAMYRLLPHKADWPREEYRETCNFIENCIVAGMTNETLNQLLREYFPSAFEKRPWWRFW